MSKAKTRKTLAAQLLRDGREEYRVSEVAPALAERLHITEGGARTKLYRAAEQGRLEVRSYLGTLQIPRHEVERIIEGERL